MHFEIVVANNQESNSRKKTGTSDAFRFQQHYQYAEWDTGLSAADICEDGAGWLNDAGELRVQLGSGVPYLNIFVWAGSIKKCTSLCFVPLDIYISSYIHIHTDTRNVYI